MLVGFANLPTSDTLKGELVIIRPSHLTILKCDFSFNGLEIEELEIDLKHINKRGRSSYTAEEISKFVRFYLDGKILYYSDKKIFGDDFCEYYVWINSAEQKTFKLVFCICSDKPSTIGVLTFYQLRKNK
jgi:hypothetical protein